MSIPTIHPHQTLEGRWNLARSILDNHRPSEVSADLAVAALQGRSVDEILTIAKQLRAVK